MMLSGEVAVDDSSGFSEPSDLLTNQSSAPHLVDKVLLSPDLMPCILRTLGLRAVLVGPTCRAWRDAARPLRKQLAVLRVVRTIGEEGRAPADFRNPFDVAALPGGAVCVADFRNCRLQILSHERSSTVYGSATHAVRMLSEGFGWPNGVACDGEALYVGDLHDKVQKLRLADGALLGSVGSSGPDECQFHSLMGLCHARGVLYCCDRDNHRVVVLGANLAWRFAFGHEGAGESAFRRPAATTVHNGELYVADSGNDRVQVRVQKQLREASLPCSFLGPAGLCARRRLVGAPARPRALPPLDRPPRRRAGPLSAAAWRGGRAKLAHRLRVGGRPPARPDARGCAAAGAAAAGLGAWRPVRERRAGVGGGRREARGARAGADVISPLRSVPECSPRVFVLET